MSRNAVVIGSGIAGIAAAIRLKVKGYDVTIFEKNAYLGGKLAQIEGNGFRFDAGPSVFTLPELVTELFELADKNPADYFEYQRHPISSNYFWNDGTCFKAPGYKDEFIKEASFFFNEPVGNLERYFSKGERKFRITKPVFLEKSLHKATNYFTRLYLKSYPKLLTIDLLKSLHSANKKQIENPRLVQVLDKFASYNGSSPYKISGIMTLMPHIEITLGTYFPKCGMHDITNSLHKLCKDLGIEISLNSEVTSISTEHKHVRGIVVENTFIPADVVVCNSDPYFAHTKLLKKKKPPKAIYAERSSSVVVFYWGINRKHPELDLHNMLYAEDYPSEFEGLFESKRTIDDASIYIHKSCEVIPTDAPSGCENWFVMIMVPSEPSLIDDAELKRIRQNTIRKINQTLNADIENEIVFEEVLHPRTIELKTNSYKGALHGTSSNSIFSAFIRHPNFSNSTKNLFFVGGSTHPGGGIPLCLLSAKIALEDV